MQQNEVVTNKSNKEVMIHFAHANGFPADSYAKLFAHLSDNVELIALDKFAHNPEFPLNNNWNNQVKELIHYVETEQAAIDSHLPIILVGHSFGAIISYLACCQKPALFSGLIMLDPPLITGLAGWVFRLAKKSKLIDKITPAGKTKLRNNKWHHKTDLVKYFKQRALFADMDEDCIADYVCAATQEHKGERVLTFDIQVETNIFRTIPDNLHKQYGKLETPSYLLTGKHTEVCVAKLRHHFIKGNTCIRLEEFDFGGHMFPLEKPIRVASRINTLIATILANR